MEFWRRWRVVRVVALMGALSSVAMAAEDVAKDARDLEAAKGTSAVNSRIALISAAKTMSLMEKDDLGRQMVGTASAPGPFVKLLDSKNPDAQLNAAIAIAEVATLSTDSALEGMLTRTVPSLRYWGAQGLGNIMGPINSVGGAAKTRAVGSLTDALATEKSGLVKMQIVMALGKAGDIGPLIGGLDTLSKQIQAGTTDEGTLDAATAALTQLDAMIRARGGLAKAETTSAAKATAWTMSFAAQQQVAMKDKRDKEGSDMPEGYSASMTNLVNAGVKVLNDLSGRGTFRVPPGEDTPAALQLAVDGLVGSASAGQGDLQKSMPDVPMPPAVK